MFTKEYWRSSFAKLKDIRYLAIIGLMIALKFILNQIRIPVSDNLNVMFSFVPVAIEAMIVGPGAAMVSAAVTDTLVTMLSSWGPYFPGYLLSRVMGSLIFGLFLYRTRFTLWKTALAKALINYGVNVALGSLWSSILYGKAFLYYAGTSLIKNTILLPFEVLILYALLKALIPPMRKRGLISNTTI
ncbi:MAG: folate family ECF transporter S component [Solobacterium sp.]|nr:folate family ECF transporter S component [Solobacterium sp.]